MSIASMVWWLGGLTVEHDRKVGLQFEICSEYAGVNRSKNVSSMFSGIREDDASAVMLVA